MTNLAPSRAEQEINRLLGIFPRGFDLSLDRIARLLEDLGRPQDAMPPVIHVAGTNGKGSATAFARALLEAQGLAVHVHTSPHLVRWHERYRIGVKAGRDGWSATRRCWRPCSRPSGSMPGRPSPSSNC